MTAIEKLSRIAQLLAEAELLAQSLSEDPNHSSYNAALLEGSLLGAVRVAASLPDFYMQDVAGKGNA